MLFITAAKPFGNCFSTDSTTDVSHPPSSLDGVGTAIYAISQLSVTSVIDVFSNGS